MPKITASQLDISASAKFFALPKPLTATFVRSTLKVLLHDAGVNPTGAPEIRIRMGTGTDIAHYSFQCVRYEPAVSFLRTTSIREVRYGFLLLIERNGYLAIFSRGIPGADTAFSAKTKPIPRHLMTQVWGDIAKYQKLSTRRMNIGRTELRGVQFIADDLENAMPFGSAGRSIPQSFRLHVPGESTRAVTPNTGKVQKAGEKNNLAGLVDFVDEFIDAINAKTQSPFLNAFSTPVELYDLPSGVVPTGLILDISELQDYLDDEETGGSLVHATDDAASLRDCLSAVFDIQVDPADAKRWIAVSNGSTKAKIHALKHSYSLLVEAGKGWTIDDCAGRSEPLERWFQQNDAFSVSYSNPEFFYTKGSLYRRAGFAQEANYVLGLLQVHASLNNAISEKGPTSTYTNATTSFASSSIFGVLESSLSTDSTLICTDLNDEWADYIGIGNNEVTFYHCKDGDPTSGASPFQIVVAQAQKNLSRIKFRPNEIHDKLTAYAAAPTWTTTCAIPRLARGATGWPGAITSAKTAIAAASTTWRVALVVTALSRTQFQQEMQRSVPKPFFIQLVWLLSAFASSCKERDAKPIVFCRT
jgi:hypothetical protein